MICLLIIQLFISKNLLKISNANTYFQSIYYLSILKAEYYIYFSPQTIRLIKNMTRKPENHHHIPDEAFLFFPTGTDVIKGQGLDTKRAVFQGQIPFTPFQNAQLSKLEEALNKQKISLPSFWDKGYKLRFLQANQYNVKKTIIEMIEHSQFHRQTVDFKITPQIEKYLKIGVIYFCGRDCKYRPMTVIDAKKIINMKLTEEQFYEVLKIYTLYIIKHFLIQGQIQNTVCLVDVGYANIISMATRMKDGIVCLTKHFKARNFKSLIYNYPSSIHFIWAIAKNFLNEDQKSKINFLSNDDFGQILKMAHPDQLEVKFGGKRPNIQEYWPPSSYSQNYYVEGSGVQLIKVSQYQQMYLNGQLKGRKVNKKFIDQIMQLDQNRIESLPNRGTENVNKTVSSVTQIQKEQIKEVQKQKIAYNRNFCIYEQELMQFDIQIDEPLSFY